MDRIEAAIERVVERLFNAWERERDHEAEVNKPKLAEVKEAFEALLKSETFEQDLSAFEDQYPGSFARLTAARVRARRAE